MRLFIAIPVPPDIRRAAADTALRLKKHGAEGRFVAEENYHVTLHFLGETDALADVADAMREAVRGVRPFLLRLTGYGAYPGRTGGTGFVAVQCESGELSSLYETLEQALWDRGFSKNRQQLTPHITIGRNITGDQGFSVKRNEAFRADAVVLYESTLTPYGARYTPVHREKLS